MHSTWTSTFGASGDAGAEMVDFVVRASRVSAHLPNLLFKLRRAQQKTGPSGCAFKLRSRATSSIGAALPGAFPCFPHCCLAPLSCFRTGFSSGTPLDSSKGSLADSQTDRRRTFFFALPASRPPYQGLASGLHKKCCFCDRDYIRGAMIVIEQAR